MNNYKIIEKYSKSIARKLYRVDIYIFFRDTFGLRAIFRGKEYPPYSNKDFNKWKKKHKPSITFNNKIYSKEDISPHIWNTLIHEITHYKYDINFNSKRFSHPKEFMNEYNKNIRKTDIIKKEFNKEIGFEENFTYKER